MTIELRRFEDREDGPAYGAVIASWDNGDAIELAADLARINAPCAVFVDGKPLWLESGYRSSRGQG